MNSKIVIFIVVVVVATLAPSVNAKLVHGCHKGYCWAYCNATGLGLKEWCYTTKGSSQDYNYVKCTKLSECAPHWKCAGPCTV